MTPTIPLGPGREFDAIRELVARWGECASGLGDDAAVLDLPEVGKLIVSTDTSVEGVHFRREWLSAAEIGYRSAAAALSDLAAMAATPVALLAAMTVPAAWHDALGDLVEGVGTAARAVGALIVGGDTTRGDQLSLTCTVLGYARSPLMRAGARPGDSVYVTGLLGGPAAAVRELLAGRTPPAEHRERFAHPVPRVREAIWLASSGATAAIDISDGLIADLGHVAAASGVEIVIELNRLARFPGVAPLDAAASGEEYELAVAAPETIDAASFERQFGVPLTRIGEVLESADHVVRARLDGRFVDPPAGYDHFSS